MRRISAFFCWINEFIYSGCFRFTMTATPVTMAVKSHLRNGKPVLIAPATNDALSASAKNIGALLNLRNIYFVPFGQDDSKAKPTSAIADFARIPEAAMAALEGHQLQPVLIG